MPILHVLRRRVLPLALLLGSVTPAFAQPRPAQPMTLAPAGGVLLPINLLNTACFSQTTKDSYIQEVAANDLGVYTGATNCASGTLRFDVSSTAITSAVKQLWADGTAALPNGFASAPNLGFSKQGASIGVSTAGVEKVRLADDTGSFYSITLGSAVALQWNSGALSGSSTTPDLFLTRGAANVLNVTGSSTIQTLNVGTSGIKAPQDKLTNILDSTDTVGVEFNVGTPTLGTCTGGSLVTGAKNSLFEVTGNTSGSCVVNFGAPIWQNAPLCFVNDETALIAIRISARTTNAITVTGAGSGDAFQVYCLGRVGT